jgi:hypothetical protein
MFIRFRETSTRLQVSLVETRRVNGRVCHEHVAGLGSVGIPATIPERLEFWRRLHERLAKLSNRIDAEQQAKLLTDIFGKIPMVTPEEQRDWQISNLEADARVWSTLSEMESGLATGNHGLALSAEEKAAGAKVRAAEAAQAAAESQKQIERVKRGESVDGGMSEFTAKDAETILRQAGWTIANFAHAARLVEITRLGGEAAFEEFLKFGNDDRERRHNALSRIFLRRLRGES